MKKGIVITIFLILCISQAFAANFNPTLLKLSADATILYKFDGSTIDIPVTVSGKTGEGIFLVYTKDFAKSIEKVQNGYLGWHYVDKIDTCVYASYPTQLSVGSNVIKWDGKDNDGNTVPAGDYTYYIWAFDNVSAKSAMTRQLSIGAWVRHTVVTHDENGAPLTNPIIYACNDGGSWYESTDLQTRADYEWVVGGDPDDSSLLESCSTQVWTDYGGIALQSDDHDYYFKQTYNNNGSWIIKKLKWVPNGEAELQTEWGESGEFSYNGDWGPGGIELPGVISDGGGYLFAINGDYFDSVKESEVIYIDEDEGTEVKRLDLGDWYIDLEDEAAGGQASAGPTSIRIVNGRMVTNCHSTCMNLMLDIYYEDENDAVLWVNQNGDMTGDHNFEEDSAKPWVCNDWNVGPYKYNISMDSNLFSAFPSYDLGAVSFGLFAPDGTGLGYHSLSGETSGYKWGVEYIDSGSQYDGIYTSNASADEDTFGWFYIGHDSISGVITNKVGVEDNMPAEFTVAQNSPNPFNPSTSINFTTSYAGHVSIDVFNAAGQKVDTLVNGYKTSGSHNVTWNASEFSAGVYFYTVRCGEFSKTMKMTLLK